MFLTDKMPQTPYLLKAAQNKSGHDGEIAVSALLSEESLKFAGEL
jgi:hypothetical protein